MTTNEETALHLRIASGSRRGQYVTLTLARDLATMTGPDGQPMGFWTCAQGESHFVFPGILSGPFRFTIRWDNADMCFRLPHRGKRQLLDWMDGGTLASDEAAIAALRRRSWLQVGGGLAIVTVTSGVALALAFLMAHGITDYCVLPAGLVAAGGILLSAGIDGLLRCHRIRKRLHSDDLTNS
jgi:hypothetical protein